jgi:hypothetical protein
MENLDICGDDIIFLIENNDDNLRGLICIS